MNFIVQFLQALFFSLSGRNTSPTQRSLNKVVKYYNRKGFMVNFTVFPPLEIC